MNIIAELGQCTNGSLDTAIRMVNAAAEAGCDGVKVQAYKCSDFLPHGHGDWAMFARNRLRWEEVEDLRVHAGLQGLLFGGTPTSLNGVAFLADIQVDFLKNGSDYLLRGDMIDAMVATGIQTWVSTGMATREELAEIQHPKAKFLHRSGAYLMACTSLYPCPDEHAELWRVGHCLGYSDHTTGTTAAVVAAARGCAWFEFHFTLDHDQPGPDHKFSRTPEETAEMVREVRRADMMLGGTTSLSEQEAANRDRWRVTEESPLRA